MKGHHGTGRWVIVLEDDRPPVFWSAVRQDLEKTCALLRTTCPTARVVWLSDSEDTPDGELHPGGRDRREP